MYDTDSPTIVQFRTIVRRAKQLHVCCRCHRTIPRGALYWRTSGLIDGEIYADIYCTDPIGPWCHVEDMP